VRPGIVPHGDLGLCGGGHHDPGDHYPIGLLIHLTKLYAHAGTPTPHHHKHHRPLSVCQLAHHGKKYTLTVKPLTAKAVHKLEHEKHLVIKCRVK
jgi:hypothetical protein